MKSFYLITLYILIIFVIISNASVISNNNDVAAELEFNNYKNYKVWLREVEGYDENNHSDGYAGIIGVPITSIRIDGGQDYTVHLPDKNKWFAKVNGTSLDIMNLNGYAGTGNGSPIDGISIAANVEYKVHVMGEGWSDPVMGNPNDLNDIFYLYEFGKTNIFLDTYPTQYAGTIGKPIDAVMIKGRKYAVSFTSEAKCCPGENSNSCCIPNTAVNIINNNNENNANNNIETNINNEIENNATSNTAKNTNNNTDKSSGGSLFNPTVMIVTILSFLVILALCFFIYEKLIKKNKDEVITDKTNNNNNNNNNNFNNNNNNNNDNNNNNNNNINNYNNNYNNNNNINFNDNDNNNYGELPNYYQVLSEDLNRYS